MNKEDQDQFNKKFLVRVVILISIYRFYIMHIDKQGKLINYIDEVLGNEGSEVEEIEPRSIIMDELD